MIIYLYVLQSVPVDCSELCTINLWFVQTFRFTYFLWFSLIQKTLTRCFLFVWSLHNWSSLIVSLTFQLSFVFIKFPAVFGNIRIQLCQCKCNIQTSAKCFHVILVATLFFHGNNSWFTTFNYYWLELFQANTFITSS